jgi:hypothetical protein
VTQPTQPLHVPVPAQAGEPHITPHPLLDWPTAPPDGYLGQLTDEHQAVLAARHASTSAAECDWYHTTELPDGTVIPGFAWDLRGREGRYLGGVNVGGKRVLELGPATGHLTFWMEAQGADVTAFEVGYDSRIEFTPAMDGSDRDAVERDVMGHTARSNAAWWVQHRERHSKARLAYGDIYDLPADLGRYDIGVFGSILLHLRDPFRAIQQAAQHVDDVIVVTDFLQRRLRQPDVPAVLMAPLAKAGPTNCWWHLSPGAVTRMLRLSGFERVALTHHTQQYFGDKTTARSQELAFFSVVARRAGSVSQRPTEVAPTSRGDNLRWLLYGLSNPRTAVRRALQRR